MPKTLDYKEPPPPKDEMDLEDNEEEGATPKKRGGADVPALVYNKQQTIAYVAHRMPGLYAANVRLMAEIKQRVPGFRPKRVIDFGSGPGTSVWAAARFWPNIKRYILVEPSDAMVEVSSKLLDGFPLERRRFLYQGRQEPVDFVVASHALSELADDQVRRAHVRALWSAVNPGGILLIIEPGTPVGFKIIKTARSLLLDLKTEETASNPHIVGPCTGHRACPMGTDSWCHFVQRVQRSPLLKSTKVSTKNWENEKFSWIAISKGPVASEIPKNSPNFGLTPSRVLRQPLKRGGHIHLELCNPAGTIEKPIIARSQGKEFYKAARKASWGDLFFLDRVKKRIIDPVKRQKLKETKAKRKIEHKKKKILAYRMEEARTKREEQQKKKKQTIPGFKKDTAED